MSLPNTYTDVNETGCCAVPNIDAWDNQEIIFKDQHFLRMYTRSFMFVPLNMSRIMKKLSETVTNASAGVPSNQVMVLSRDLSPWKAEHLYRVSHPIEGHDVVTINGTFLSRVFEGSYADVEKWYDDMQENVLESDREAKQTYFFYTTCPKCAKKYGKNYVIGLSELA